MTAKASSLARRSKPLSSNLTTHYTRHSVADLPYYASSLAVNLSFSQLAGAKAVGSKRWGSVSFSEMEKLERLFRAQLKMTSKSLWLMSGILAMLKCDGFQPTDPTLFNAALASASATLSQTARSSAAGSTFVCAKRRDSLLAHTEIPVPETQRRAPTMSPGSESLLFDEEILGVVVSQVQQSSLISSNLAMSRSLERGRGHSTSSLAAPSSAGAFHHGQQRRRRSSSASKFNSRKRSPGGGGGGGVGSFFRTFGFPEVGAITLPDPVRRLSVPPLAGLDGQRCGALGGGGVAVRIPHSFPLQTSSNQGSRLPAFLPPFVHQRGGSGEATRALVAKSAVELAPLPYLGFYSWLFVVWKTSESWRPIIDLSILSLYVDVSHFRMETIQSVFLSVCQGDWMASIDLKEAYLQVPVHPDSRRFLWFVAQGNVYQFSALCFGLSTAPQVFSRVMAPVSAILHSWGIRMRRYLDNWLVQSSSRESLLRDLSVVLDLCHELGIVVNPAKSHLVPSQIVQYLGVVVDSQSFRASPSPERIARLRSTADAFLSCTNPPASTWLSLLGMLSSLSHLVLGGRLRVRSLQLCLHRSWDRGDQSGFLGLQTASGIFSGGSTFPVCLTGCLWIWTFGPTPQTWAGELIWVLSPLRAFGIQIRPLCPSTLESFWPSGRVSSTSALLWSRRMWQYFATTPQQYRISARRGAPGRRSSTPWLRKFSVGRSPSPSDCYPSSFRGP